MARSVSPVLLEEPEVVRTRAASIPHLRSPDNRSLDLPPLMLLLRLLLKAIKTLNSETSASSLAAAFALGVFVGFVPLLSLQAALVVLVVLLMRVNLTAWIASVLVGKLVGAFLTDLFDRLGTALLENEGLRGLWTTLTHDPVLGLLKVGDTIALGGTLVGLAALVPAYLLGRVGVKLYRARIEGKVADSPLGKALGGLKIVTLYKKLTTPFA